MRLLQGDVGSGKTVVALLAMLQAIESGVPYGAVGSIATQPYVTNPGYVTPPGNSGGTAVSYYFTPRDAYRTDGQRRTDFAANYTYHVRAAHHLQLFGQLQVLNVFNQFRLCGCGNTVFASTAGSSANSGDSVEFSKINNIPIAHHQGPGSITDITIRRLLTLQGAMRPDQIISDMSYKGQSNTVSMSNHSSQIQVSFTPLFGANNKLSSQVGSALKPGQWTALINHISQIPEPVVPIAPSKYSIRAAGRP